MRAVEPQVYMVGHSALLGDDIVEYLESVDGLEWWNRRADSSSPDGELLIEFGGRLCYRSWKPGLNVNVKKVREDAAEYFDNLLKSGHGSVLEHSNYSFVFHNVSRVFTHELVRHRAGSAFSQESMRFVRLTDIPFWFPEWAKQDQGLMNKASDVLFVLEGFQTWMAQHFDLDAEGKPFHEKKAKTSFMRRFAPEGVATGILWTANIRTLRHVIKMRTDAGAEEEIRLVFDKVAGLMRDEEPILFGDFTREDDGTWVPLYPKV